MKIQTKNNSDVATNGIFLTFPTTDIEEKRDKRKFMLWTDIIQPPNFYYDLYPEKVLKAMYQNSVVSSFQKLYQTKSSESTKKINIDYHEVINIKILKTLKLKSPLNAVLEDDGDGFICRLIDIPLYGFGDDRIESVENLKNEIESLYNDLIEDDNFSDEWLEYKKFLNEIVIR